MKCIWILLISSLTNYCLTVNGNDLMGVFTPGEINTSADHFSGSDTSSKTGLSDNKNIIED